MWSQAARDAAEAARQAVGALAQGHPKSAPPTLNEAQKPGVRGPSNPGQMMASSGGARAALNLRFGMRSKRG